MYHIFFILSSVNGQVGGLHVLNIVNSAAKNNGILLSHEKNEIMPFVATWMDLEIIILSEVNQKEKEKYAMTSLYVESKL